MTVRCLSRLLRLRTVGHRASNIVERFYAECLPQYADGVTHGLIHPDAGVDQRRFSLLMSCSPLRIHS